MIKKFFSFLFIDDTLKEDVKFLKKVELFKGISDRALAKIALLIFKKSYLVGEKVYEEKQAADVVYVVKSGQIQIKDLEGEGISETGDFFGEISLVEGSKHNSCATALKNSELYLIYRVKFNDMAKSDTKTGFKIMRNLSKIFASKIKC